MAIGLITELSAVIQADVIDAINNSNASVGHMHGPSSLYHSPPWEPIRYTSMTGWMIMNYTLLACLIALPIALIYAILQLV